MVLNWSTATEINNRGFNIERSNDGSNWSTVGFVGGKGTTSETSDYIFVDNKVNSGSYSYRLKQIDFDGSSSYSKVVNVDVIVPAQFELSQNYPNPFNPSTTINFSIPVDSHINILVFDVLGQEVTSLLSGFKLSGSYKINFDAGKFNSGVYFYKLTASGVDGSEFTSTKKMILTK